jgi:hypothetical protein
MSSGMRLFSKVAGCVVACLGLLASSCPPPPGPGPTVAQCNNTRPCFLTRKGGQRYSAQTDAATVTYYNTIDPTSARRTFGAWKTVNGFGGSNEVRTVYFNNADLKIGRDMHCVQSSTNRAACYVTNYGPAPGDAGYPDATTALSDAVAAAQGTSGGHPPFATVAMEWTPYNGQANNVTFYIFDGTGNVLNFAILDTEGKKSVPAMCMACHGGTYNAAAGTATAASFLPFVLFNFQYSPTAGFTRTDQEEAFRKQNEIVLATHPNPTDANDPIGELMNGLYANALHTSGSTQRDDFIPAGWTNPSATNFYLNFMRPYCRTCHMADQTYDFATFQAFKNSGVAVKNDVCTAHTMPQAEVTWNEVWAYGNLAPGQLDNVLPPAVVPPTCGPSTARMMTPQEIKMRLAAAGGS